MVVWWGTPIEARSAFARLVREDRLTGPQRTSAIRLLNQLRGSWDEILPSEQTQSGTAAAPEIRVVLNWFEELKQRVPSGR